jgi:PAS domain S-box-containing protein
MNGTASLHLNRGVFGSLRKGFGVSPDSEDRFGLLRVLLAVWAVALSYYPAILLGLRLRFPGLEVAVFWPSNALLLTSLLLSPPASWWLFIIAVMPAHFLAMTAAGIPLWRVWWQFANNTLLVCGLSLVLRYFRAGSQPFPSLREWAVFLAASVILPLVSSFGSTSFVLSMLRKSALGPNWSIFGRGALSNITCFLLLTPVLVSWVLNVKAWLRDRFAPRIAEAGLLCILLLTVGWWTFSTHEGADFVPALVFLPLPLLIWAALRFGQEGASTALLGVVVLSLWGAMAGKGPFVNFASITNVLSMQFYWLVLFATLVPLAIMTRERATAEASARENERRLQLALGAGRMGVWDWDLRTNSLRWSAEHFEILGLTRFSVEPTFETWAERVYPPDLPAAKAELHAAIAEKRAFRCEYRVVLPGGGISWAESWGQPIYDETEQCARVMGLIMDITDRKRSEEANRNLAHASRLAVLGELTALIAHEINQPLGATRINVGAAELLLDSGQPRLAEVRQILTDIRKDNERAAETIYRIRALLRKQDMEMSSLVLKDVISEALQFVSGDALTRHVEIQAEFAPKLPDIRADKVQLQQVLLNLLLNGMESVAELPLTTLTTRRVSIRTGLYDSENVIVTIADNGPGIAPDKLPHIFESFFTTKRGGMGLGLAITKAIIENHKGRIWAENSSRGGTAFRFTLPVSQGSGDSARSLITQSSD